MKKFRICYSTDIDRIDRYTPPTDEGSFTIGVAAGMPRGCWGADLVGSDCNGDETPVCVRLTSGHYVGDYGVVYDADITDVRTIYIPSVYTHDEALDLIMSAFGDRPMADPPDVVRRRLGKALEAAVASGRL